jgi:Uncharacterised protein family (UPF0203)
MQYMHLCEKYKEKYDTCQNVWYEKEFMAGKGVSQNPCRDEWEDYKECVDVCDVI